MIEFKRQYSMKNGNKVTKKNWHRVIAVSSVPTDSIRGIPIIDEARKNGGYYMRWRLVKEHHDEERTGFIFKEINAGTGIDGFHPTFKEAIWSAIRKNIRVFLEPESSMQRPESRNQNQATSIQP